MTKPYMGQIMAECDCQHAGCEDRGYCMADRIETLVKERDEAISKRAAWELEAKIYQARADRLKAALFWCSGSADFNDGGVAREGWLKVCAPLLKGTDQ